jgi:hypothetical protein
MVRGVPSHGQPPLARPWQRLLEREGELRAIDQALDAARASHGAFVAVEGIPGVGKTALLASAGKRAGQAGMLVLHARGGQLEREFSFGVAHQLFELLLLLLLRAAPSERGELLDGAAASAAALVGAEGPAVSDGGAWTTVDAAFRAVHGFFWLAANIAAATPLVLIVDDLQWCDAGSLRWLAHLGRRLEGMALVVVVGMHPGEPSAAELLVAATADAHVLRPAPLSPAAVELLVGDRLAADPDDDFCSTCHAMTGGNPLLVRELLTALAEEHVVPAAEACARVRQIGSRAITRIVRGRLARWHRRPARSRGPWPSSATTSTSAARAPWPGSTSTVPRSPRRRSATAGCCASMRRWRSHPLERGAVYEAIAPLERESVHAHAARMLAGEHARVQQIAAHLLHCPPSTSRSRSPYCVTRRARYERRGAPDAAVAYLRRALCEPLGRGDRAEILLELGLAEKLVDLTAAVEHLREARSLLDGDERRAQAGLQLARTLFLVGLPGQAVAALDEAIALLAPGRGELRKRLQAEVLVVTISRPELHPIAQRELERIDPGCAEDGVARACCWR